MGSSYAWSIPYGTPPYGTPPENDLSDDLLVTPLVTMKTDGLPIKFNTPPATSSSSPLSLDFVPQGIDPRTKIPEYFNFKPYGSDGWATDDDFSSPNSPDSFILSKSASSNDTFLSDDSFYIAQPRSPFQSELPQSLLSFRRGSLPTLSLCQINSSDEEESKPVSSLSQLDTYSSPTQKRNIRRRSAADATIPKSPTSPFRRRNSSGNIDLSQVKEESNSNLFYSPFSRPGEVSKNRENDIKQWLLDYYHVVENTYVTRKEVFDHYVALGGHVVSASAFGKIVRLAFPGIKCRRLGKRGDSKYCYFGLARRSGRIATKQLPGSTRSIGNLEGLSELDEDQVEGSDSDTSSPNSSSKVAHHTDDSAQIDQFFQLLMEHSGRCTTAVVSHSIPNVQQEMTAFWLSPTIVSILTAIAANPIQVSRLEQIVQQSNSIMFQMILDTAIFDPVINFEESMQQTAIWASFCSQMTNCLEMFFSSSNIPCATELLTAQLAAMNSFALDIHRRLHLAQLSSKISTVLTQTNVTVLMDEWTRIQSQQLSSLSHPWLTASPEHFCLCQILQIVQDDMARILTQCHNVHLLSVWLQSIFMRCLNEGRAWSSKSNINQDNDQSSAIIVTQSSFIASWLFFCSIILSDCSPMFETFWVFCEKYLSFYVGRLTY